MFFPVFDVLLICQFIIVNMLVPAFIFFLLSGNGCKLVCVCDGTAEFLLIVYTMFVLSNYWVNI